MGCLSAQPWDKGPGLCELSSWAAAKPDRSLALWGSESFPWAVVTGGKAGVWRQAWVPLDSSYSSERVEKQSANWK